METKTKVWIGLVVFLLIYTTIQIAPYQKHKKKTLFAKSEDGRPLVIAHGGAKKLYPENTTLAFERVSAMGVDAIELDVCLSKDDVLLTHHNLSIDATSDHTGKVRDYTYNELITFNFGYHFKDKEGNYPYREVRDPALLEKLTPMRVETMFANFDKEMLYIVEIKDGGKRGKKAAELLNKHIIQYGLQDRVCVASFDQEVLDYFKEIKDERIITSLDYKSATNFVVANLIGYGLFTNYEGEGLQLPMKERNIPLGGQYLIWKVHKNAMFVHYWTIDKKQDMKRLIQNGADGIISDRPDLLFEVLSEMGYEK